MFIHRFEGSWWAHPFWRSRFRLTDEDDLARIRDSDVAAVIIDEARGVPLDAVTTAPTSSSDCREDGDKGPVVASAPFVQRANSFDEERDRATALVKHSTGEMKRLFDAAYEGAPLQLEAFMPLVNEVVASMSRNQYALLAVTRLKKRDEYTYVHSLAVAALMTQFARQMKMSETEVFEFGLAGLLHDIGKMIIPDRILKKPDALSDEEFALVRTHPEQGYRLLSQQSGVPAVVLDICRHHHERLDGTGYPSKLKGEAISRAARMAAICDVYDALTSNRSYKPAWTPEEAITRMDEWTGHFDRDLLFHFMKAIGVFPAGLLVHLRSNRLGMTMGNGRRASRATVRAFFCARDHVQLPLEDVTLDDNLRADQILSKEYALDWGIADWPLVAEQLMKGQVPQIASARARTR